MAKRNAVRLRILPPPEMLPPPGVDGRWSSEAKSTVVRAIASGQICIADAKDAWGMDISEIMSWMQRYKRGGTSNLRSSAVSLKRIITEDRASV